MVGRTFYTPLRYPGGKGKFSRFIKGVFEANNLQGGHYVEPYAGGAAVALELLFLEYVEHIHINDFDPAVYSFWRASIDHTNELIQRIIDTEVSMEEWYRQKKVLQNVEENSLIDVGFATFFLNRTNRSGILKAGVIGGKEQSGDYRLDARFNKDDLCQRIERIGSKAEQISVYNLDAVELISDVLPSLPARTLVYLDPPYYVKGSGLYRNYYEHEDHEHICTTLQDVTHPWIVSYDNVPQIREIYHQFEQDEYFLSYTAQAKKQGAEVMIYGPGVIKPSMESLIKERKLAG